MTILKYLAVVLLLTTWVMFTPYIPAIVPATATNIITVIFTMATIAYLLNGAFKGGNWG
jgi:hypothetical protein